MSGGRVVLAILLGLFIFVSCGDIGFLKESQYVSSRDTVTVSQSVALPQDVRLTNNPSNQSRPVLAYDAVNKQFLVTWVDYRDSVNNLTDIYGKICSFQDLLNSTCSGSEIAISNTTSVEDEQSVAYDSLNKKYLIVWVDGTHGSIKGRFIKSDGTLEGNAFDITTIGSPSHPSVVYNDVTKDFNIAWLEENYSFSKVFSFKGLKCTNNYSFSLSPPYGDDNRMVVAAFMASNGSITGTMNFSSPVLEKPISDDGSSITTSIRVFRQENTPEVFFDPLIGTPYIIWTGEKVSINVSLTYSCPEGHEPPCFCLYNLQLNEGEKDPYQRVYVRKVTGGIIEDIVLSNSQSYSPKVAIDSYTRRAFIAWYEHNDQTGFDISSAIVSLSDFRPYKGVVVTSNTLDQTTPYVSFDSVNRRYLVVWEDGRNGGYSNIDVYGQFIDPDGSLSGSNFRITTSPMNQLFPRVVFGDTTFPYFFIVWHDGRIPDNADIYGNLWKYSTAPLLEITTSNDQPLNSIDFGAVNVGSGVTDTFRMWNKGNSVLRILHIQGPSTPFTVLTSWPETILPDTYHDISVNFVPTTKGVVTDQIVIESDGGNKIVYLKGTGLKPVINLDSTSIDFGSVNIGEIKDAGFTISNGGNSDLIISSTETKEPFYIKDLTIGSIGPGESVSVTVSFKPDKTGKVTSKLTITSNDIDKPVVELSLSGEGIKSEEQKESPRGSLGCAIVGDKRGPDTLSGGVNLIVMMSALFFLLTKRLRRI